MFNDPRHSLSYYVTSDMKCVLRTTCVLPNVLQPSITHSLITTTALGTTTHHPYYTCIAACSTNYVLLTNLTCSTDSYCGTSALLKRVSTTDQFVAVHKCSNDVCGGAFLNMATVDFATNVVSEAKFIDHKLVCFYNTTSDGTSATGTT
jgi:hypothetical protein